MTCTVNTGKDGKYDLVLHEVASSITLDDIECLKQSHAANFLKTLVLDDNRIGNVGATVLAKALRYIYILIYAYYNICIYI